jgi:hypothetical protein
LKTPPVFKRNVEEVMVLAESRDQPFLLLTYAYYVPDDYSNERFIERDLDYSFTDESVDTEVWGLAVHIQAGIEAHNGVTRKIAAEHPELPFFDMERFMPKDGKYFIDICHWTNLGQERFVQGITKTLRTRPEILRRALERR